jgi:hypothetical protein
MNPLKPQPRTHEQDIATHVESILAASRQLATEIARRWCAAWDRFYATDEITAAECFALLGTGAKTFVAYSRALLTFLVPVLQGSENPELPAVLDRIQRTPALTEHNDGTVTLA